MRLNAPGGSKLAPSQRHAHFRRSSLLSPSVSSFSLYFFVTRWLEAEGHRRDSRILNTMVTVYPHLRNALGERDNAVWRFSRSRFVARERRKEKLQGWFVAVSLPSFESRILAGFRCVSRAPRRTRRRQVHPRRRASVGATTRRWLNFSGDRFLFFATERLMWRSAHLRGTEISRLRLIEKLNGFDGSQLLCAAEPLASNETLFFYPTVFCTSCTRWIREFCGLQIFAQYTGLFTNIPSL